MTNLPTLTLGTPGAPPGLAPAKRSVGRLRVDGADIHYEVCGTGPAIVFAHGLGGSHLSWWQQVAHFAPDHTCVTFAHRGFTPSSVDTGSIDPARYADDLAALLDDLAIERAHLVGQSMGGWTMVEFSLRHPNRVRSLVLSATTGSIAPERLPDVDRAELVAWKHEANAAIARCVAAQVHPAAGSRMAIEQPALHQLYQDIDALSFALDRKALRARLLSMCVRSPDELAATGLAVLLVSPDEDIVIPPLALRSLANAIPGARLARLAQAGHSPYFEHAEDFNRHLDEFFEAIDREARRAAAHV